MKKVQVSHWRGKRLSEMTKEQLIEVISDAHHLWRVACQDHLKQVLNTVNTMSGRRR